MYCWLLIEVWYNYNIIKLFIRYDSKDNIMLMIFLERFVLSGIEENRYLILLF